MKTNKDRQGHFTMFRSPTPGEDGYKEIMDYQKKKLADNPKLQKKFKESFKKATSIVGTQLENGIGLSTDEELRYFLAEFNSRTWNHGFGSLPASFNILEAFFKWNPDLFFFELNNEEEHLFSLFDFVDFITSKNCTNSIDYFKDNVDEDVIYSYNILNEIKEITFKTTKSKEFVVSGVSFILRGNEVSMLMVAGEICDTDAVSKGLPEIGDAQNFKPYLKKGNSLKREAVKLLDQKDLWKQLVYVRINLDSKTIDSRYLQKDDGDSFSTITDDIGMLIQSLNISEFDDFIKKQLEDIGEYDPLFELAQHFLFLPEYFNFYDKYVIDEEHPTKLLNKKLSGSNTSRSGSYSSKYFFKSKDVWVLDRSTVPEKRHLLLVGTELNIEKDGYWKYLEPGKIGSDRKGNPIHNRTWVEKTLTWFQTKGKPNLEVSISDKISTNSGFIYLLRNPAHELDIFKIGLTTLTVEERARQLSGTSSPDKFLIISRWHVSDCVLAEKLIHDKLNLYRLSSKREFFKISIENAIEAIGPIIKIVNESNSTSQ